MEQARAELIHILDVYNRGLLGCTSDYGINDYWLYVSLFAFMVIWLASILEPKDCTLCTILLISLIFSLLVCNAFFMCYRLGDTPTVIYSFTSSAIRYGCKYKSRVISLDLIYQDKLLFERIYNNSNDFYDREQGSIIHAISILRALTIENCTIKH